MRPSGTRHQSTGCMEGVSADFSAEEAHQRHGDSSPKTTSPRHVRSSPYSSSHHPFRRRGRTTRNRRRTLWFSRALFYLVLAALTVSMAFWTKYYLHRAEEDLAAAQFVALAQHAVDAVNKSATLQLCGSRMLAQVAGHAVPDVDRWPFINVPGFDGIAADVMLISGDGMSVVPIVTPEQVPEYESFAYEYYARQYPNETLANNGRGIFHRDCGGDQVEGRCHDATGAVEWDSSFPDILTPKFLHSKGNHPSLLLNVHHEETKGRAVDAGIRCAQEQQGNRNCQAVSEMVFSSSGGAGAFMVTPIAPDGQTVTGFVFAKIDWEYILMGLAGHETSGIDVVISTAQHTFTYTLINGQVVPVGKGDHHDPYFDDSRRSVDFAPVDHLAPDSVTYTISFYANDDFDEPFHDKTPRVAALGAAGLVIFTSCLFILYDYFVRREHHAQTALLEAKRQFVRFVSHEVRTPLNSVVMGLTLLEEEISRASGLRNLSNNNDDCNGEEALSTDDSTSDDAEAPSNSFQMGRSPTESIGQSEVRNWHRVTREVHANAQSSIDVLNDLLNYDKVESGTLSLELTAVPIFNLIHQTVQEFTLPITQKHISMEWVLPESDLAQQVMGDSVRLSQVLRNLVSNAIKFTPRGGSMSIRAISIDAGPKAKLAANTFTLKNRETVTPLRTGTLQLEVQDSGAGLTKSQISKLFRRGVQFNVNDLQAGQGSGLGLYIAKGIIEQHGGSLTASSEGLGRGSTFVVTIPLYQSDGANTPSNETQKSTQLSSETAHQPTPLRMLIVDDAVSNRRLLARLLENRGHACETAENGEIALQKIRQAQDAGLPEYNLILLDYEMPVLNGPATSRKLRDEGNGVFIVGITGNMLAEDVAYFLSCGANSVLPKPFQIATLEQLCMEYSVGTGKSNWKTTSAPMHENV